MISSIEAIRQAYLTADIPGVGGVIKETPEDFRVEEIPAYQPCGSGSHLYLRIEKTGITTLEAVRRMAQSFRIAERDVGYAGMKDAVGVTVQTVSLPGVSPESAAGLDIKGIRILSADRHNNKLKLGHLRGNCFRIAVRGVAADAAQRTEAILERLSAAGVPNWFGIQRYGIQANSHLIGAAMLRGDWREAAERLIGQPGAVNDAQWRSAIQAFHDGDIGGALQLMPGYCRIERDLLQRLLQRPDAWEKAFNAVNPRLKRLYLSAFQSSLFDRVVEMRLPLLGQLQQGDIAFKHENGACFLVDDAALEQQRADAFKISPTGPMFGCKMKQPQGEAWEMERQVLAGAGVQSECLASAGPLHLDGERRPLRVPLANASFKVEGDTLLLEFSLPRGSYATAVVREFTKNT